MEKIDFRIYRYKSFSIHLLSGYIEKIPIVEYKDRILIMDGGCRSDFSLLINYINKYMKRSLKEVNLMIASHIHPDHSGSVSFFKKHFKIPIAAPKDINLWYAGLRGYVQHKIDTVLGHYVAGANGSPFKFMFYPRNVNYDYVLYDKTAIPFFEDWTVFSAKGHTTHDVVFYNKNEDILYAADVVLQLRDRLILPIPVTFPCLMKKSIKIIEGIKAKHIFLAHGGYLDGKKFLKSSKDLIRQAEMIEMGHLSDKLIQKLTRITPEMKKYNKICKSR